jgi:hypothetical protein
VFRVGASAHPDIQVETVGASPPVAFMMEHARRRP